MDERPKEEGRRFGLDWKIIPAKLYKTAIYYFINPFILKKDPKAHGRGVRRLPFRKALKRDIWTQSEEAQKIAERWDSIRRGGGTTSFSENSD